MKIFLCFLLMIHVLFGLLQVGIASGKIPQKTINSLPQLIVLHSKATQKSTSVGQKMVNLDTVPGEEDSVARWEKLRREQIGELAEIKSTQSPQNLDKTTTTIWNNSGQYKFSEARSEKDCLLLITHGLIFQEHLGILYREKVLEIHPLYIWFVWLVIFLGFLSLPGRLIPTIRKQDNPLKTLKKSIRQNKAANTQKLLRDLRMEYLLKEELPLTYQKRWLQQLCEQASHQEALEFGAFLLNRNPENKALLKQFIPWLIQHEEKFPLHLGIFLNQYFKLWPDKNLAIKVWDSTFAKDQFENHATEAHSVAHTIQIVAGIQSPAPR